MEALDQASLRVWLVFQSKLKERNVGGMWAMGAERNGANMTVLPVPLGKEETVVRRRRWRRRRVGQILEDIWKDVRSFYFLQDSKENKNWHHGSVWYVRTLGTQEDARG